MNNLNNPLISLSLSGGGSRAIAFHLGCLRALNKLGTLNQVNVISCVSGGSVIGTLYSYSNKPFAEFDEFIVRLLSKGLTKNIFREIIKPTYFVPSIINNLIFYITEMMIVLIRLFFYIIRKVFKIQNVKINNLYNPILRKYNRTYALEKSSG
ncbi:MAG: patatin-like phospholipase family protein [Syntrophothermus sp.]